MTHRDPHSPARAPSGPHDRAGRAPSPSSLPRRSRDATAHPARRSRLPHLEGFAGVTVSAVAQRAELSTTGLLHHLRSKDALLLGLPRAPGGGTTPSPAATVRTDASIPPAAASRPRRRASSARCCGGTPRRPPGRRR
ncbi:helix-turn-helix domain-containing protein [Rathayibacter sp. PhB186]|uniref:TetR/AcrR family transcriptional regulator n=1 Tax=Rathayibacter sp. PhB186 TaxID=2485199 RepID=UPI000F4C5A18